MTTRSGRVADRLVPSPLERYGRGPVIPLCAVAAAFVVGAGLARSGSVLVGVGLVLCLAVGLAALARPDWAAVALVGVVPVLPGLRRGLPIPGLRLSEVLVVGAAAVLLLAGAGWQRVRSTGLDRLAVLYVATSIGLGLLGLASGRGSGSGSAALLGPLQFLLLYRAVRVATLDVRVVRRSVAAALLVSVPVSVLALVEQLDLGPTRTLILDLTASGSAAATAGDALHRSAGPFAHWHSLAGYLTVILVLLAAVAVQPGQEVLSRRWMAVVGVTGGLALLATVTLVAVIGTSVGVAAIVLRSRRRGPLIALAATSVLLVVVSGPELSQRLHSQYSQPPVGASVGESDSVLPQTVQFRIDVWTHQYAPVLGQYLLTGYGAGVPPGVAWTSTESVYLSLLLRGGLPLLIVWTALVLALWRMARLRCRSPVLEQRALGMALTTLVPVAAVMQLVHPYFLDAGFPHLLWGLAALLAGGRQLRGGPAGTVAP